IYKMQVRAIMEAACGLSKKGVDAKPEIMIPGIGSAEEMKRCRAMAEEICTTVQSEIGVEVAYKIGTMIELPRATAIAYDLAEQ
ncbi:hypothetical protein OVO14_11165, partial [Streptococcus pneumoniae]|nr:hypothetical protein [Streptococcus pneumoniae]